MYVEQIKRKNPWQHTPQYGHKKTIKAQISYDPTYIPKTDKFIDSESSLEINTLGKEELELLLIDYVFVWGLCEGVILWWWLHNLVHLINIID